MKWIEAKVIFDHQDDALAADLISDLFYDFGLQGVVVDDPDLAPEEDWAEDAIGRPTQYAITGYFHKDGQAGERCKTLEEKLTRLKEKLGFFYRISYKELDEQDWAHAWKAFFLAPENQLAYGGETNLARVFGRYRLHCDRTGSRHGVWNGNPPDHGLVYHDD